MADRQGTLWPLAPHTAAKHTILAAYLGAWFPILARWNSRVVFVDGFAGPGEYEGGEPGSPIIALEAAINHKSNLSDCELIFTFVERDRDRYRHLERLLKSREARGGIPSHVVWSAIHGEFDTVIDEALDGLEGRPLAPAFVMIDPFGPSGVPYDLIRRLAGYERTELLVSFMYESISRWLMQPEFEKHLDSLYGCPEWRDADGMEATAKRQFLHDLYRRQLEDAGMPIVKSFQMLDKGGRTEYFLFFATHHPKGWSAMKDAMWRVDPSGAYRFSDATDPAQQTLFQPEPDYVQLRQLIEGEFAGSSARIEDIEAFVDAGSFRVAHLRKNVLVPMEDAGELTILSERRRARSYPPGTVIEFPSDS